VAHLRGASIDSEGSAARGDAAARRGRRLGGGSAVVAAADLGGGRGARRSSRGWSEANRSAARGGGAPERRRRPARRRPAGRGCRVFRRPQQSAGFVLCARRFRLSVRREEEEGEGGGLYTRTPLVPVRASNRD
jgi:hypothetical protein